MDSRDPEPPEGSKVRDCYGREWDRDDGPYGGPGKANWVGPEDQVESWVKVAGNYGPVELLD